MATVGAQTQAGGGGKRKGKKIGGNWVEIVDPDSGKTYYANMKTKEVSWQRPSQAQLEVDSAKPKIQRHVSKQTVNENAEESEWVERQDPKNGTYWYNKKQGVSSRHRPTGNVVSSGALTLEEEAGRGAWVQRIDPKTKRPFYYNPVLQKTSWTNPDEERAKAEAKAGDRRSLLVKGAAGAASGITRFSQRLSNIVTGGGPNANRSSARYSLAIPAVPVNRTSGRMSMRFGAATNRIINEDGTETHTFQPLSEDRFAKLRAMKNKDVLLGKQKTEDAGPSKLEINLDELVDELDLLFDDQPFERYADNFFAKNAKMPLSAMLTWTKTPLKTPLHPIKLKELKIDAKTGNSAILHFMGDSKKKKKNQEHWARILMEQGNGAPEEFKNELFSQLIRQTTNNPNPDSLLRGWQLIALCCGVFMPDKEFLPFLKTHIKKAAEDVPSAEINKFAKYALLRLEKSYEVGDRLEIPSNIEMSAVFKYEPLTIRVHLINSTAVNVHAETWTTVKDVNTAIEQQLGINDGKPFTTFEIDDIEQERVLDEEDRVLDVIAYWEREVQTRRSRNYVPSFQFVYKMRLFFDIQEDDTAAVELAYYQAVNDVTDSRYPCSESDAIKLAALEAQEKFGDYIEGEDVFGENLGLYIQHKYYDDDSAEDMKAMIYSAYKELSGYTPLEAKLNYLDYVKAWKIYGSAYFIARPQNTRHTQFPPEVVIAVNNKGVLIVDPLSKDFLGEYPYAEIVTWGHSATTFVLVVGNLIRSRKIFFGTDQGIELNALIHAYVHKLLEVK